jgi:hypothetical protein
MTANRWANVGISGPMWESPTTALRKITSKELLKYGKNYGIAVYVPKKMVSKIE